MIAIFLPVIFMSGVVGRYFFQFGVTLSLAVGISYVEAVTLAPARCARLLANHGEAKSRVAVVVDRVFTRLANFYHRALSLALTHPWKVLGHLGPR